MAEISRVWLTLIGFTVGLVFCFLVLGYGNTVLQLDTTALLFDRNVSATTSDENKSGISEWLTNLENGANNDTSVSDKLFKEVRVLCWIMTHKDNLKSKAMAVKKTWGKRCNKLLFSADHEDEDFPTIDINVPNGRNYLSHKTFATFQYVYDHHMQDADWFMKADDDTYVVMENLRHLLSSHSPDEPVYFGHLFKAIVKEGYASGGAGYILSKEAMQRFGKRKATASVCNPRRGASEDVEMGKCLQYLKVTAADGRDKFNRTRFHCLTPLDFIQGKYPDWLNKYSKWSPVKGLEAISDYAVSFHYINVQTMYLMDYVLYHLRPYGVLFGLDDLNKPRTDEDQSSNEHLN